MDIVRRRVIVRGKVQGVFFRDTTRQTATAAGVAGWVRNLTDGTVEAVFEGPVDAVTELIAFCHEGPPHAEVNEVTVTDETPNGAIGFSLHPTGATESDPG
jgi:acylphosphatase